MRMRINNTKADKTSWCIYFCFFIVPRLKFSCHSLFVRLKFVTASHQRNNLQTRNQFMLSRPFIVNLNARRQLVRCLAIQSTIPLYCPPQIMGNMRLVKTNELKGKDTRISDFVAQAQHTYDIGVLDGIIGELFIKDSVARVGWFDDDMAYRLTKV